MGHQYIIINREMLAVMNRFCDELLDVTLETKDEPLNGDGVDEVMDFLEKQLKELNGET